MKLYTVRIMQTSGSWKDIGTHSADAKQARVAAIRRAKHRYSIHSGTARIVAIFNRFIAGGKIVSF